MYYQLIDVTPGSVPIRKGIFRTEREANLYILDICGSESEYQIVPYEPEPDLDILFEILGDDSGLLVEIPWDMCRGKQEVGRYIDGRFETLKRIEK
jgi:hypothetical protein